MLLINHELGYCNQVNLPTPHKGKQVITIVTGSNVLQPPQPRKEIPKNGKAISGFPRGKHMRAMRIKTQKWVLIFE